MNVEYFKEEFTNFIERFAAPNNDQNILPIVAPLTYQEILEAVKDVINLKLEVIVVDSNHADVKTPAAGIIVTTPDAPDIPKVNGEHGQNGGIPGRFRSSDTLTSDDLKDSPTEESILPETRPSPQKIEDNVNGARTNVTDAQDNGKKEDRKFSPSKNTLVRSDTYVRESELKDVTKDDEFFGQDILPEFPMNGHGDFPTIDFTVPEFRKSLDTLRDAAIEVLKMIDDTEKVVPDNTRPIRRLSTIGCFPGVNRASVASRTIQRPKLARRSMTAFPGTPTSSRMSPSTGKPELPTHKNIPTAPILGIGGSRPSMPSTFRSVSSGALVVPKKPYLSPCQGSRLPALKSAKTMTPAVRSVSSSALKLVKKSQGSPTVSKTPSIRAPALSLMSFMPNESQGRGQKNPKYAHVQSTIPKPGTILGKRKADEF